MKAIKVTLSGECADPSVEIFPDSSMQKTGKPFFVPDFAENFRFKALPAIRIDRLGKNITAKFASRYYAEAGLCLSIVAEDLAARLSAEGVSDAVAKAFDGALVIGDFYPVDELFSDSEGVVAVDGREITRETYSGIISDFDKAIAYVSRYFTVKIGDLLILDRGQTVSGEVTIDTHLEAFIGTRKTLDVKMK